MSTTALIETFKLEARRAGVRANCRNCLEAAQDLMNLGVDSIQLSQYLQTRYKTLSRMQYDTLGKVVKDMESDVPYIQRPAPIDIHELDDEAIAMLS